MYYHSLKYTFGNCMTGEQTTCTDNSATRPRESARIHEGVCNNWDRTSQKTTSSHKAYSIDWV